MLLTGCFAAGQQTGDRGGHRPAQNQAKSQAQSQVPSRLPATSESKKPARAPSGSPGTRASAPTDVNSVLARSLEPIRTRSGTRVSVAVMDPRDGRRAVYGSRAHVTASIVKVDILAALLLRAQRERRPLTRWEASTAASMIQSSDNASANALWRRIGRGRGLTDANRALGLTSTQAGPGPHWGLTRTTAADQLALLSSVFDDHSPLKGPSRDLIQTLMGQIDDDQDWGVSAAGSHWQLKNGWLPRSHSQRWEINSMGRVKAHGRIFYLVILSHGSRTMSHGISAVEQAAQSAVRALCSTPPLVSPIVG
ncbi:serine hydrolase [Streptomyces sp. NPDC051219]|uniref:serine hydrolase n=1 Tax=Streptomyces sp. NPDC051219 TaxID=3155283 RepID=UPI00343565AC